MAAKTISFELARSHIFIRVNVNGTGTYLFLLDTGAGGTIIASDILSRIGIRQAEEAALVGVGEGPSGALLLHNIQFSVGELTFSPESVFATSLDVIRSGEGRKVDGVIGYDFFKDHVVEIDYEQRTLRVLDHAPPGSDQNRFALTFIDRLPIIGAIVTDDGRSSLKCQLEVDTGATRPLLLSSSFMASHPTFLVSRSTIRVPLIGAGAEATQRITRMGRLTLGRYAFDNLVTGISESRSGLAARQGIDGMIGGELLERLRLVINYSEGWISFHPSRSMTRPFEYDMSGLILFAKGSHLDEYVVRYVVPNSPATEANVRVDDIILSVDGKLATDLSLSQIGAMFSKPGRTYRLAIKRSGKRLKINLKTRRLV